MSAPSPAPGPSDPLSGSMSAALFTERIAPRLFHNVSPTPTPTLVVIAGQPGAGTASLRDASKNELAARGGVVIVDADTLRKYHPNHRALMKRDPAAAMRSTQADAERWERAALAEARRHRLNVTLETALHDADRALELIGAFKAAGYRVEVRALAVPERDSLRGLLARSEEVQAQREPAVVTPIAEHAAAYRALPVTLRRIESETRVDRVSVIRRTDEIVYDNRQIGGKWQVTPPIADKALDMERERPRTREELQQRTIELDRIEKLVGARETATAAERAAIAVDVKQARQDFRDHINRIPPPSRAEARRQSLDQALRMAQQLGGPAAQLAGPLPGHSYKGPILGETKDHVLQGGPSLSTFVAHEKARLAHTPPIGHLADVRYSMNAEQQASVTELRMPEPKQAPSRGAERDPGIER